MTCAVVTSLASSRPPKSYRSFPTRHHHTDPDVCNHNELYDPPTQGYPPRHCHVSPDTVRGPYRGPPHVTYLIEDLHATLQPARAELPPQRSSPRQPSPPPSQSPASLPTLACVPPVRPSLPPIWPGLHPREGRACIWAPPAGGSMCLSRWRQCPSAASQASAYARPKSRTRWPHLAASP